MISGVGYGTKRFFKAIGKGIGGVVTEPVKGAKENGFLGATLGVGKGLIGLVAKPVGGTFELVQHTVQGTITTPADIKARWFADSKDSNEDKQTNIQLGESSDIKLRSESLFTED